MSVTKSNQNNLTSPNGNSLAVFVDINDDTLKLKDINGNVEGFNTYLPPTPLTTGLLQLQGGVALSSTLTSVTDQNNTASTLKLSTTSAQFVSPLRISTDDASEMYLDCEDGSENNRFNITRNGASQQVNLNFASNPVGSTTTVGAIRTFVNGTNLSEVMEFREDGNVKVGGVLSVGNYANSTGFGQKIRVIGQGDASVGIYRNQASSSAAKLEFMKSRGTYDAPVVVNAGDLLGNVGYFGYNGTSYSSSAAISSGVLSTSATGVEGDVRFILYNNTGSNFNTMRLTKEGVGIGSALDYIPSATLQVRGSGSTSATTSLLVQNSAGTAALQVQDNLNTTFGGSLTIPNFQAIVSGTNNIEFQSFRTIFGASANTLAGQYAFNFNNGGQANILTSGTTGRFNVASLFAPTSGTAVYNTLEINATINQTGGANGITRGLYINPTLTAAADFRAIEVSNGGAYINTTSVQASAILQADSTTKGFLPPRMTTAQKVTLAATAVAGLMIYDTNLNKLCVYTGAGWETITSV